MLHAYLDSDTTISEQIAMGGNSDSTKAQDVKQSKEDNAAKTVASFDAAWDGAHAKTK